MDKRIGDYVKAGEIICTLHARDEASAREAEEKVRAALTFSENPANKARLLYALVTPEGVSHLSE